MKYKFLPHTADIKFQAFGKNPEEVFSNSAYALFNSIHEGKIRSKIKKEISVRGTDFENLLYNFLEEFLFLFDSEGFFLSKIKHIKIDPKKFILKCEIIGDFAGNYELSNDVKAVTYNDMFVRNTDGKWTAQVVIDV